MAKLRPPSLQHMAHTWREDPDRVCRILVSLAKRPPPFSYEPLFGAIRDMLVFNQPYEQIETGIKRGVKRPWVQDLLLEVLPLIHDHFDRIHPDFPPQEIAARPYQIARDIQIPFKPPLIYAIGGQLYLPWFSFWRKGALAGKHLSLFMTIVDELMEGDPDLEKAKLQILDFSIPKGENKRSLVVFDGRNIPRLDKAKKNEMLMIWADGFRRASAQVAGMPEANKQHQEKREPDSRQEELFLGIN